NFCMASKTAERLQNIRLHFEKHHVLQADSLELYQRWIDALQSSIARALTHPASPPESPPPTQECPSFSTASQDKARDVEKRRQKKQRFPRWRFSRQSSKATPAPPRHASSFPSSLLPPARSRQNPHRLTGPSVLSSLTRPSARNQKRYECQRLSLTPASASACPLLDRLPETKRVQLRSEIKKKYDITAKTLSILEVGDIVRVQHQTTKKWDLIAKIMEIKPRKRSYLLKTLAFSSGVAAITAVIHLLNCGDHWIVHDDLYPGVIKELRDMALKMGIETTFVDARYCDRVRAAMQPNTRLVWIEPITNPLLNLVDVEAVARVVQEKKGCVFAVDNTFLTGYFLRPLEFGATLVIYSATKYLNGHNDVTLGYVALNDDAMYEALWNIQQGAGSVPSPFECYLLLRSLKTLPIRMEKHMTNGLAVARYLQAEPHVEKVIHPGLDDYSSSALLRHQCSGYSGMVAFYLRGCAEDAHRFVTSLRVVSNADSLGGCESTAKIPACLGTSYTPEEAALRGITPNLVRMSVGLEDPKDIIADLDQALKSTFTEM
ncbi:unnamed protein product, partial [Cyprideis torosa]